MSTIDRPPSPADDAPVEGWGGTILSMKKHYFIDGRALCGVGAGPQWGVQTLDDTQAAADPRTCKRCLQTKRQRDRIRGRA